jgi:hypothetical protein
VDSQWVLISISLVAKDVEHVLVYLLAILTSSFEKCSIPLPLYGLHYFLFLCFMLKKTDTRKTGYPHVEDKRLDPCLSLFMKINSKWTNDLNGSPGTQNY